MTKEKNVGCEKKTWNARLEDRDLGSQAHLALLIKLENLNKRVGQFGLFVLEEVKQPG